MTVTLSKNRLFSAILAAIYVIGAFITVGGEGAFKVLIFLIFPLTCIWFSEAMGGYTGPSGSSWITAPSPGIIVCILGWIVLLLPALFMFF
jgi:hypothetical protein